MTLTALRSRTLTLIEADIARNNELLSLARGISDPRQRAVALGKVEEHIERTREIVNRLNDITIGERKNGCT